MINGFPRWKIETFFNHGLKEEQERVYASRWILVSYYDDAFVNFMQFDIDRHGPNDDDAALRTVARLTEAARHYGFDIVWTTSPGFPDHNKQILHGLYAWIRLDQSHFVMDIVDHVHGFLHVIGLNDIAIDHEGAYLKKKKLVRLPGQFNVELADPQSFCKINSHPPIDAVRFFQDAWIQATPMKSEVLISFPPPSPLRRKQPPCSHSSVTPSPLPPHGDTFEALLRWGREIVDQHYPNEVILEVCVSTLVMRAREELPSISRTRQYEALLRQKAEGIISYLWTNTTVVSGGSCKRDAADARRFRPHADYIRSHRISLLDEVPERLRIAAGSVLDLMLERNGRIAVVSVYHGKKTPICTYRNWKRIQVCWGLTTLVEYAKPVHGKGTCRQWGFACIRDQKHELRHR